jgi:hypothetical protein
MKRPASQEQEENVAMFTKSHLKTASDFNASERKRTLIALDSCAEVVKGCYALCQMLGGLDRENSGRIALWNIES